MIEAKWPYNLPIWRRFYQAASPDGALLARIDPAYEVSMGNPTSGILCISSGLHIPRCNPSFVWSDDSRYLAVPQYFHSFGIIRKQRLLVIDFGKRRIYASKRSAYYFQPESFVAGRLVVSTNPFHSQQKIQVTIPAELDVAFRCNVAAAWPEMSPNPPPLQPTAERRGG